MEQDIDKIINDLEMALLTDLYGHITTLVKKEDLEHLIKAYKELEYKYNKALSDLVQADHKNKELEEEVMQKDLEIIGVEEYTKESMGEIIEHYYTANEDCIPVSLVEELDKEEQELQNSISDEEREEYSDANISFELMDIEIRRSVLQKLLEKVDD